MKQGKTLSELVNVLQDREESKKDYVADTRTIEVTNTMQNIYVGDQSLTLQSPVIDTQLCQYIGMNKKYYDLCKTEQPALLASNLNTWFNAKQDRRLVRGLYDNARAFLSDRYKMIDNYQVAMTILQTLTAVPGITSRNVVSCEVTDKRLYIKIVFDKIQGEVAVGDVVESGLVFTNSEVGLGGLNVRPFIHRLVCTNGMWIADAGIRKRHLGNRLEVGTIEYQTDTIEADNRAIMLELRDTILASADQKQFNRYLDKMKAATQGDKIEKPVEAVEVIAKTFTLSEGEKNAVLENLIQDRDYSRWGALNAVTKVANTYEDYDRASELEAMGGQILELPQSQWRTIANAA